MGIVIAQAILSWVNPHIAAAPMLVAITYPFLQPLRRVLPLLGGVDLSPMLLLILCQLIVMTLIGTLERMAFGLF
jgi:YggT family protein